MFGSRVVDGKKKALETAGLWFIIGARIATFPTSYRPGAAPIAEQDPREGPLSHLSDPLSIILSY